jgi:hypothetical protein
MYGKPLVTKRIGYAYVIMHTDKANKTTVLRVVAMQATAVDYCRKENSAQNEVIYTFRRVPAELMVEP